MSGLVSHPSRDRKIYSERFHSSQIYDHKNVEKKNGTMHERITLNVAITHTGIIEENRDRWTCITYTM